MVPRKVPQRTVNSTEAGSVPIPTISLFRPQSDTPNTVYLGVFRTFCPSCSEPPSLVPFLCDPSQTVSFRLIGIAAAAAQSTATQSVGVPVLLLSFRVGFMHPIHRYLRLRGVVLCLW